MAITVQAYPAHTDKRNMPWFEQMFELTPIGGQLHTNAGVYIKASGGWVQALKGSTTFAQTRVLLRGAIDEVNQRVSFDLKGVTGLARAFVLQAARQLNQNGFQKRISNADTLVYVMWASTDDYCAMVVQPDDVEAAWAELQNIKE